jgi:flagellar biosynthesis/type III secretory pathway M-ring protein FliF/YscJ
MPPIGHRSRDPREATQTEKSDGTVPDIIASVKRKIPLLVTGAALMMVVVSALVWHFAL